MTYFLTTILQEGIF